ncbi:PHD finger protein ING2 [Vitis vinifera]|uniref:PHD finger protein ING2 n=1 Tax=Vitis vinifera TaxID=29760 RepID=A0A438JKU0_VITVI|nr:PHD finger protein ING2 [Vitis vinifera]
MGNGILAVTSCQTDYLKYRGVDDPENKIDSHVKRLDEDLTNFAEDLKQEGKISPDEPAILPPLPIVPKNEKRKFLYGTPQPKRVDYRDRDWDRERDRDFELMPPPGSHRKDFAAPLDVDQPIDPNEPTYCVCHQVSFGDMIACDNENLSFYSAKEANGSTTHVLGSHQRPDSKESGIVQPAGYYRSPVELFQQMTQAVLFSIFFCMAKRTQDKKF